MSEQLKDTARSFNDSSQPFSHSTDSSRSNSADFDFSQIHLNSQNQLVAPKPLPLLQELGYREWMKRLKNEDRELVQRTTRKAVVRAAIVGPSLLAGSWYVFHRYRLSTPLIRKVLPITLGFYSAAVAMMSAGPSFFRALPHLPNDSILKKEFTMIVANSNPEFIHQLLMKQREAKARTAAELAEEKRLEHLMAKSQAMEDKLMEEFEEK